MKYFLSVVLLVLIVAVSGCTQTAGPTDIVDDIGNQGEIGPGDTPNEVPAPGDDTMVDPNARETGTERTPQTYTIEMTASGFVPSEITIVQGDTVTWTHVDGAASWPATAQHPFHTLYPGSGITRCGTGADIFDACAPIGPGQTWSFTFNEVGEWAYHNHIRLGIFGRVIVEAESA